MWDMYLECMEHFNVKSLEEWKVSCERKDDQQYREYLCEIELPYRNTLYCAMLITFSSLIEHVIVDITNEKVEGYEEKKKRKKGNWLVKHIELLNECGFEIDLNDDDIKLFSHFIQIRNCVVHNGGRISNSKYPHQLEDAIEAIDNYAKTGNFNMIEIKDDYLMIGSDLISDVVNKSERIIENIIEKI